MPNSIIRFALAAAAVLLVPSVASAQQHEQEPDPRLGFFGGFGLHVGNISCEGQNCDSFREAVGLDLHAGFAFNPQLAIIGDLWGMANTEDNLTISQTFLTAGVRAWPVRPVWVQAGLGLASARFKYEGVVGVDGRTDNVPALVLGAGVEVLRGKRFAMDVQLRVGFGFYGDDGSEEDTTGRNASLGVGFTWF